MVKISESQLGPSGGKRMSQDGVKAVYAGLREVRSLRLSRYCEMSTMRARDYPGLVP